jgi:uncharacterized protein YwqG
MGVHLSDRLRPLARRCAIASLRPRTGLALTDSKFGGLPYAEEGDDWPVCKCGMPMAFICQMDVRTAGLSEELGLGFFTFFYCHACSSWGDDAVPQTTWTVRTYGAADKAKGVEIAPDGDIDEGHLAAECAIEWRAAQSLPDWDDICDLDPDIVETCNELNSASPWEAYDEASQSITGAWPDTVTQLGGFPEWIQGAEMPPGFRLLAQIDSEDKANLMWGDVGRVYLFVSESDPKDVRMCMQCC